MIDSKINWMESLRSKDSGEQAAVLGSLRSQLQKCLRSALNGRSEVGETHLEDFAQVGLLRILERLDQFQGRSNFSTWARSIALNAAYSELRYKCWQEVSLEVLLQNGERMSEPEMIADDALGTDDDRLRLVEALRNAIEKELTSKQRAAILAELHELPFEQIVGLLGTNRSAGYKMLHDARRALKRNLGEAGITAGDIRRVFA